MRRYAGRHSLQRWLEMLVLVGLALVGLASLPGGEGADPRVYLWPKMVLYALLVAALGNGFFDERVADTVSPTEDRAGESLLLPFLFMLFYMGFTMLMYFIGFIFAAPVFLFLFMLWINHNKGSRVSVRRLLSFAIVVHVSIVVIFVYTFKLFMPYGMGTMRILNERIAYLFR